MTLATTEGGLMLDDDCGLAGGQGRTVGEQEDEATVASYCFLGALLCVLAAFIFGGGR